MQNWICQCFASQWDKLCSVGRNRDLYSATVRMTMEMILTVLASIKSFWIKYFKDVMSPGPLPGQLDPSSSACSQNKLWIKRFGPNICLLFLLNWNILRTCFFGPIAGAPWELKREISFQYCSDFWLNMSIWYSLLLPMNAISWLNFTVKAIRRKFLN